MRSEIDIIPSSYDLITPSERVAAMDQAAREYLERTTKKNTARAYADDWNTWVRYCTQGGIPVDEVTIGTYTGFALWLAKQGKAEKTIRRRLTGVRVAMNKAKTPIPDDVIKAASDVVRAEMDERAVTGQVRERGKAQPFTVAELRAMSLSCPDTLTGIRDRALLVLGFALGARRAELAGLLAVDVVEVAEGLIVTVRVSKTGLREVAIPYGQNLATCPVRCWNAWSQAAGIDDGRAFRSVDRHGNLGDSISPDAVGDVVIAAAERAGLGRRTAHGLRSGMATAARAAGHDAVAIAASGGWKPWSREMLGYMHRVNRWTDNPLTGIGL